MSQPVYTRENVLEDFTIVSSIVGKVPSRDEFVSLATSGSAYKYYFSSFGNLVKAAGAKPRRYCESVQKPSVKELIEELKKVAIENPEEKRITELIKLCKRSRGTYNKYVGDKQVLMSIINNARENHRLSNIYTKRYPIAYFACSSVLMWNKKRTPFLRSKS